jgi:elongation factor P
MKVNAITLRSGHVINYNEKLCVVLKQTIMQPGKGAAVIQVEMRDLKTGNKDNVRFRTQEVVERVRLDQGDFQFLYADGDDYNFMNQESFEQISITGEIMGDQAAFLKEGMVVTIESYEGSPIGVEFPQSVIVEVLETEPVVKGQTASSSYKPATVEGGVRVMVPPHIDAGTKIVVKTEDSTYVERAK